MSATAAYQLYPLALCGTAALLALRFSRFWRPAVSKVFLRSPSDAWAVGAVGADHSQAAPDRGIALLEHVNVNVPEHPLARRFYFDVLGCAVDPRRAPNLERGVGTMWANIGASQIHLPAGPPQVVPGAIHLAYPDLGEVRRRLEANGVDFEAGENNVVVTCPYGNRYVLSGGMQSPLRVQPGPPSLGSGLLGVEVRCASGTAPGIARFYRHYFAAEVAEGPGVATVRCGEGQFLRFRESAEPTPPYDGHHVALYLAGREGFRGAYDRCEAAGLVWANERFRERLGTWAEVRDEFKQFRVKDIVDPLTKQPLHTLEHEVRANDHPSNPYLQ